MTPVSDERLADLAATAENPPGSRPPPYVWDEFAACLRELQAFRAERTRQMQEG